MRYRRAARKMTVAACGALLLAFLALALFFSLLAPDHSFAQREKEATNVNFIITMDHEGEWPGSMGVVSIFIGEEITVDSKWAAHAQARYTAEEYFPATQSDYAPEGGWECELKGDYSFGRKELTGTIKVSGEYQEPTTALTQTENFEGTLKLSFDRDPMVAKEPPDESTDSYWFDYENPIGTGKITGKEEISYIRGGQEGSSSNDISVNVEAYILVGGEKAGTTEGGGEDGEEDKGGDQKSDEGSKVPGPRNWWEWLTGTALAGAVAAGAGLIGTLFGGAPPLAPDPVAGPTISPWTTPDMPEPGIAGGTADPFDTTKYPNQPGYIGDSVQENLSAAKDAVGPTLVDTGVALKDGVFGFVKGVASIPIIALEGFVQIGRILAVAHTEATEGGPGVLSDMISPSVAWDTLKNIWGSLGKEVLPIDEFGSFFDPNASLEEMLWAIPSAAAKIANLIMMSEKLATKPVPGLDPNFTFIRSAKPGLAIEAAVKSADPAVKAEYDAYRAAGKQKASDIAKTVEGGGKVSQEQVLDAMSDPATMRVIKKAPEAVQKEFAATQAKEVYQPVYDDMVGYMKGKDPKGTYRVGGVRTPGQKSLINTDNDVIVEELVHTRDGKPYWKEVPAREWEGAYYDSFSKRTGFTPEKAKTRFPEKDWDHMTPMEQKKAWTEAHGQECMDVKNPEAAQSFSNQPTVMDPKWKPGGKSPVADGRIVDGEGLYNMEKFKTARGFTSEGTAFKAPAEAMEQGCKLCDLSKKMAAQSMQRTGKPVQYPEIFKQGETILKRNDLPPAVRDQALKNLGFKGGYEEFMDKLSSWTGRLP